MENILLAIFLIAIGLHLIWEVKYTRLIAGAAALTYGVVLLMCFLLVIF